MSDYLIHYGIKGMKWGVRKQRIASGVGHPFRRKRDTVNATPTKPSSKNSKPVRRTPSAYTEAEHFRQRIMNDNMYRNDVRDLTVLLKDPNLSKADREHHQKSLASLQRKVKSNENRKAIISKANQETRPLYDNWAKQKYGSDQWFEAREKYAKAIDSYGTQYVHAAMKDFGTTKVSDAAISVMKQPGFMDGIPSKSPYLNTDYHAIATPDGRDYDLEPAYEKWKAKHK